MNHLLKLAMVSTLVSGSMIGHAVASEDQKGEVGTSVNGIEISNPEDLLNPMVGEINPAATVQQVEQETKKAETAASEANAADTEARKAAEDAKQLAKVAVVNQKVDKVKEKADIAAQAATNATEVVVGFANKVITNIDDLTKVLETNAANVNKVDDIEKLSEDTKNAINLLKIALENQTSVEMTSQVAELGNDAEVLAHIAKSANNAMKAAAATQAAQTSAEGIKNTAEEKYKKDLENTIKDNDWAQITQESTYYRYANMLGVNFVQGDSTQLSYTLDVKKDNLYLVYAVCDGGECKTSFALKPAQDNQDSPQDSPVENLLAGDPSFGLYDLKAGSYTIKVGAQCLSEDKLCALSMSYGELKQD